MSPFFVVSVGELPMIESQVARPWGGKKVCCCGKPLPNNDDIASAFGEDVP